MSFKRWGFKVPPTLRPYDTLGISNEIVIPDPPERGFWVPHFEGHILFTSIQSCTDTEAVKQQKAALKEQGKLLCAGGVKSFNTFARQVNVTCGIHKGTKATGKGAGRSRKPEKQVSPLWTMLMEGMAEEPSHNICNSKFEAKAGIRASFLEFFAPESRKCIIDAPVVKKASGRVAKALKGNLEACSDELIAGKGVLRAFDEKVGMGLGAELRSKRSLPAGEWARKVFAFFLYGGSYGATEVAWAPYGMMQAQLVISGTMVIIGLKTDTLPGHTYEEKRNAVSRMTMQNIKDHIDQGGFFCRFEQGVEATTGNTGILIPTGFLILTASRDARVLRWSLTSDEADTARVRDTLRNCVQSFPEFRTPEAGYMQFGQALGVQF